MKIKTPVIVLSIILGTVLLAVRQQAADDSTPKLASQDDIASRMGILFVDMKTFKVVGPGKEIPQNEGINSPEACRQRQLSVMRVLDPEAYYKLFPKTPEQQAAIDQSIFEVEHHDEYVAQRRAKMTPQELEDEAALAAARGALLAPIQTQVGPPPDPSPGPAGKTDPGSGIRKSN